LLDGDWMGNKERAGGDQATPCQQMKNSQATSSAQSISLS
jgi:hypothetical protein